MEFADAVNSPPEGGRLPLSEKLSYAAGEVASNLAWNMVAGFLLFYYTDVALLPIAAMGTLMLVTRVLDAIVDPIVGLTVDRTRSRFGKARPYLIGAAIPFGLLTIATFSVPAGFSPEMKLVYAYVTFTALGLLYSLLYIPYSAMLPMMTRDHSEKVQLGSFRSMASSIASIFVYGLTLPIVHLVGGADSQKGFTVAAMVMGGITAALYYVVVLNCRERIVGEQGAPQPPMLKSLGEMTRNPVWRIVFTFALLIFVRIGVLVSGIAYFAKDVLQAPWMISVLLPLLSVAILLGGFLANYVFRRTSKRTGNLVALALSAAFLLMMPFAQHIPVLFITLFVLANVGSGIQATTNFILMADSVEMHEERFGYRAEGLMVSSVSFGIKVGMALGTALTGYVLAAAGYNPAHATPGANTALSWLFYGVPVVLLVAQGLCLMFLRERDIPAPLSLRVSEA